MKTRLIAIAASAALVLIPIGGVAAASATTAPEEAASSTSSPATSTTDAGPTTTAPAASTPAASSPSAAPSDSAAPAGTEPAAGSSPSTTTDSSATSSESSAPLPSSSPSTSPSGPVECTVADRSRVHAERVGPASFRAWTDAGHECGAWVATFGFDGGYVPTSEGDYRHAQTALEWGYAQLTTTPTVHSVPAPTCGPFQSDLYVGPLVFRLADGELGGQWRAGGVVLTNPACDTPTEEPTSTPTNPAPSTPAVPTPTAPTTGSESPSTSGPAPITGPSPTSSPTAGPSLTVSSARSASPSATEPTDAQQPGALAYTGTDAWPLVGAAAVVILLGILLFQLRRILIARADRKDAQR